jgi:hypothetical protein
MARTGKVAGEASRQVLAQGANVAFHVRPQGAIVGGVAIVVTGHRRAVHARRERRWRNAAEVPVGARPDDPRRTFTGGAAKLQELYSGDVGATV